MSIRPQLFLGYGGPTWPGFLGRTKHSLWSIDLFDEFNSYVQLNPAKREKAGCDSIAANGSCKNHKQALVSMTEQVHRLTYLHKVETKDAESIEQAIVSTLKSTGLPVLTKTADNGWMFGHYENIARKLDAEFYFAHPYSSWQRGANENSNGLVRQFFPIGTDFTKLTQKDLKRVERRLYNRPRSVLK